MSDFKIENIKNHKELFNLSEELESIAEEVRCVFNDASEKSNFRRSKMIHPRKVEPPFVIE